MAFDEARAESVLFGGWGPGQINLDDTWVWNGATWTQRTPAVRPSPRRHHGMAYDRARQRVVLYGGVMDNGTILGDTWEWNGVTWNQVTPIASPPSRWGHSLAWDGNRNHVVAFGGTSSGYPNSTVRNDTWSFNGTTWTPVTTAVLPPGRLQHAMTYDESRQSVLLHGGLVGHVAPQNYALNDTWELTASGWPPVSA
ncbi:MAG: hypothetical protein INH34_04130 [Phycisphaerales bacterium]|nr:hypothetical protein [Phycisphaerales bacterium]